MSRITIKMSLKIFSSLTCNILCMICFQTKTDLYNTIPPILQHFFDLQCMCLTTHRSTVEFAREVSEAKAMEDTINKFEETFGSGSGDSHVIQKHGASTPSSPTMVGGSSAPLNPLSPQDVS